MFFCPEPHLARGTHQGIGVRLATTITTTANDKDTATKNRYDVTRIRTATMTTLTTRTRKTRTKTRRKTRQKTSWQLNDWLCFDGWIRRCLDVKSCSFSLSLSRSVSLSLSPSLPPSLPLAEFLILRSVMLGGLHKHCQSNRRDNDLIVLRL